MEEREMKLQKSKEKMQGVMTECTFKPNLSSKKRPLTNTRRPLTSIPSPKKPTIPKQVLKKLKYPHFLSFKSPSQTPQSNFPLQKSPH